MLGLGSYRVVDRAGGLGYSLLGHLVLALAVGGSRWGEGFRPRGSVLGG